MNGPCLCGDLYCSSCGPAQGNIKCFVCGVWSLNGGCADPEKCAEAEEKIMEQMDRDEEERERFEEIWGEPSSDTMNGAALDWAHGYGRRQ